MRENLSAKNRASNFDPHLEFARNSGQSTECIGAQNCLQLAWILADKLFGDSSTHRPDDKTTRVHRELFNAERSRSAERFGFVDDPLLKHNYPATRAVVTGRAPNDADWPKTSAPLFVSLMRGQSKAITEMRSIIRTGMPLKSQVLEVLRATGEVKRDLSAHKKWFYSYARTQGLDKCVLFRTHRRAPFGASELAKILVSAFM